MNKLSTILNPTPINSKFFVLVTTFGDFQSIYRNVHSLQKSREFTKSVKKSSKISKNVKKQSKNHQKSSKSVQSSEFEK